MLRLMEQSLWSFPTCQKRWEMFFPSKDTSLEFVFHWPSSLSHESWYSLKVLIDQTFCIDDIWEIVTILHPEMARLKIFFSYMEMITQFSCQSVHSRNQPTFAKREKNPSEHCSMLLLLVAGIKPGPSALQISELLTVWPDGLKKNSPKSLKKICPIVNRLGKKFAQSK